MLHLIIILFQEVFTLRCTEDNRKFKTGIKEVPTEGKITHFILLYSILCYSSRKYELGAYEDRTGSLAGFVNLDSLNQKQHSFFVKNHDRGR